MSNVAGYYTADGRVFATVAWQDGVDSFEADICEVSAPQGYELPAQPCVRVTFTNGNTQFPQQPVVVVNKRIPTNKSALTGFS